MFKPKKRFGQHFLNDDEILHSIVQNAELQENDEVWEIGPGTGNLTDHLLRHKINLTIYEIDNDLIAKLNQIYSEKCQIVHGDFIQKIKDFSFGSLQQKVKIVTNLPYQISSPFLFKIAENHTYFASVVVMLQKEVAMRVCGKPSTKSYGVLTLKIQFYFLAEYLFGVSRNKFSPPPDVDSAVIKLTPRREIPNISNPDVFWKIVEVSFSQRRKTLRNNLKQLFNDTILHDCPIDLNRRGESLYEEEFITLYDYLLPFTHS